MPTARIAELRARLTPRTRDLLDAEDSIELDTWRTWSAIAMGCRNAGFDEDDFGEVALDSDAIGHTSRNPYKLIETAWRFSEKGWRPPSGDKTTVRRQLAELSQRIATARWGGRSGSTDRAVALTIVGWGHEIGAFTFGASTRFLAERAGCGDRTVGRSLHRLAALGLLSRDADQRPGGLHRPRLWVVNLSWNKSDSGAVKPLHPAGDLTASLSTLISHPLFLRGALGPTAARVWLALPEATTVTASEVATLAGLSPGSARYNLRRMTAAGLVAEYDPVPGGRGKPAARFGCVEVAPEYLDQLAAEYGTSDWADLIVDRHDRQRIAYAIRRASRGWMYPEECNDSDPLSDRPGESPAAIAS